MPVSGISIRVHAAIYIARTTDSSCFAKNAELKRKYDLLTSVKGVNKVLTISLLVYTHGFAKMEDGRKLA